jgi:hypothetical protein
VVHRALVAAAALQVVGQVELAGDYVAQGVDHVLHRLHQGRQHVANEHRGKVHRVGRRCQNAENCSHQPAAVLPKESAEREHDVADEEEAGRHVAWQLPDKRLEEE